MLDVAIIGAGALGGAIAHRLACQDHAAHIRLIDEAGQLAAGKALDLMQAAPIQGFSTKLSGTHDLFEAAASDVIVLADRATRAESDGDEELTLVGRLLQIAAGRPILCAGADHRMLVERIVRELGVPRERVFGSAPEALRSALRAFVALEALVSPRDVSLTVLGAPPAQTVVPWEQASVGGLSASRALSEPALRRLSARVAPLWPPGPYALAAAAVKALSSMNGSSREEISCFVAPDDSHGRRARAVALPVRLAEHGIAHTAMPPLSIHDQVALDNAMLL